MTDAIIAPIIVLDRVIVNTVVVVVVAVIIIIIVVVVIVVAIIVVHPHHSHCVASISVVAGIYLETSKKFARRWVTSGQRL